MSPECPVVAMVIICSVVGGRREEKVKWGTAICATTVVLLINITIVVVKLSTFWERAVLLLSGG